MKLILSEWQHGIITCHYKNKKTKIYKCPICKYERRRDRMKRIMKWINNFFEGKWILKPCNIRTHNPELKALLNIILIVPKALLYLITVVAISLGVPSLILSPIGMLILPSSDSFIAHGFIVTALVYCIAGVIFVGYIIITTLIITKYKLYRRYYRMCGGKK